MYRVILEKQVEKFLKKHAGSPIISQIEKTFTILALDPYINNLDIKIVRWLPSTYRVRVWKYRFLYEVLDDIQIISVSKADSRWNIYKNI